MKCRDENYCYRAASAQKTCCRNEISKHREESAKNDLREEKKQLEPAIPPFYFKAFQYFVWQIADA